MGVHEKLKYLLENNFRNKNLDYLNRFRIMEHVLNLDPYGIIKICRGGDYRSINTNISKLSLIAINFKI
jgi:hypothetical protein